MTDVFDKAKEMVGGMVSEEERTTLPPDMHGFVTELARMATAMPGTRGPLPMPTMMPTPPGGPVPMLEEMLEMLKKALSQVYHGAKQQTDGWTSTAAVLDAACLIARE